MLEASWPSPAPDQARLREEFLRRFVQNDRRAYLDTLRALVGWSVLERLSDQSPLVRSQAALTAAELGGAAVRPTLETRQRVELDSNVQSALEEALEHLPR